MQVKYILPDAPAQSCVKQIEDKGGVSMLARHRNEWLSLVTAD